MSTMLDTYDTFLRNKMVLAKETGFDITDEEIHPILKPHQRAIVRWAVAGGRRAIFASFGLGKSLIQLEICRLLTKHVEGKALIVCPLGVRQEFARDAAMIGLSTQFIRTLYDMELAEKQMSIADDTQVIYLTNYESVRTQKLDPRKFSVVSLDEANVLRGFGSTLTFREMMRLYEGSSSYRFCATATPDPNAFEELLAYAAFLDIMDVSMGKTLFFKRDSTHADKLTLHEHRKEAFWKFVASWAVFLQKPSDLCQCEFHRSLVHATA